MSYWIKLHDSTLENEVWRDDRTAWHIFEYLCLMAYRGHPQGVVVTTRQQIANATLINTNTVYKALKRLQGYEMINIVGNNKFSTIRICNWHTYQGTQQQPDQNLTNEQQQESKYQKQGSKNYTNRDRNRQQPQQQAFTPVNNRSGNSSGNNGATTEQHSYKIKIKDNTITEKTSKKNALQPVSRASRESAERARRRLEELGIVKPRELS